MFRYDSENHLGFWNDKRIPSITQLLEIEYPMGDIPLTTLQKASERGTKVHNDIDDFNKGLIETCETQEGRNYATLNRLLGLKVVESERKILIMENDEAIAFGTLDQIVVAEKDTQFAKKGEYILDDTKTISAPNYDKITLQTNFYAYGYEMETHTPISKVCLRWLREEKCEYRPLERLDNNVVFLKIKDLVSKWRELHDERLD